MHDEKVKNETLKYITDWHKRAKSQQSRYNIVMIITFIIAVVICSTFVVGFRNNNQRRIFKNNEKYIEDSALQEADHVEQRLNDCVKLVEKYSKQYFLLDKFAVNTTIEQKLDMLCDRTLFDRIAFIDTDGNDTSVEGSASVADRRYFQKAIQGKSGYDFIEESRVTGKPSLIFYSPIRQDDEIVGVIAGFYERERIDDLLTYKLFNYPSDSYLVNEEGIIIANSLDKEVSFNMFERLSEKNYSGSVSYEDVMAAIEDKERTSLSFRFEDNGAVSIGVFSQFNNEGRGTNYETNKNWMILSVLPYSVTSEMVEEANRAGRIMLIAVIAAFVTMIAVIAFILLARYRKLEKDMLLSTESLVKTSYHDRMQSFIIESLGNTYSSVYHIDITTNEYKRINEKELSSISFPDLGKWQETYDNYVHKFVEPQYYDDMLKLGDMNDFTERLGENENLAMEYQRTDEGWRKAFFIPSNRDENGKVTSAIFAVQKIQTEKQKELETQKALKEAYEAAQLASTAKTTFLSNMSHDIRTPMNAIVGMTAIAGANIDNKDKVSDCLKKINGASKHLLGLINEVLDMSKIESGKVDLSDEEFSLSDLIDELINMNQSLIREKDHVLTVRINKLVHENVIGDSTRLQQVFGNLLSNAIKYTPKGGKLEIIINEKETNKSTIGWYEVQFKDNGIGMSEDFCKRIFDPFSRADDNRVSTIQGTGLGMAIARNIVRMMNGDLTVESEINKGSTFTVSFALKLQTEEEIDYNEFIDLPVLVVDDDLAACESTCTMLDSLEMHSEYVTSGKEAVEKTAARHDKNDDYYAVIIDWKMPDMDGVETTRQIRKKVGDEVPIIVLTAYDWSEIEQEAKEAGVNAFLGKPLFKSRLVNVFKDFMNSDHTAEKPSETKDLSQQDFSGKRILLAEDNELNQEIAVELLSMMGLEVETAENGSIALEKFVASEPGYYDFIFMDIQMPVMNGYEAASAIRASEHPDAKNIPIVAMTANAFSTDVRSAYDSGMNGHVSKPIDMNNVIKVLNEHLGGK